MAESTDGAGVNTGGPSRLAPFPLHNRFTIRKDDVQAPLPGGISSNKMKGPSKDAGRSSKRHAAHESTLGDLPERITRVHGPSRRQSPAPDARAQPDRRLAARGDVRIPNPFERMSPYVSNTNTRNRASGASVVGWSNGWSLPKPAGQPYNQPPRVPYGEPSGAPGMSGNVPPPPLPPRPNMVYYSPSSPPSTIVDDDVRHHVPPAPAPPANMNHGGYYQYPPYQYPPPQPPAPPANMNYGAHYPGPYFSQEIRPQAPGAPAGQGQGVDPATAKNTERLANLDKELREAKQRLARCEEMQALEIPKATLEVFKAVDRAMGASRVAEAAATAASEAKETMASANTDTEERNSKFEVRIVADMEERHRNFEENFEERMITRIEATIDKMMDLRWAAAHKLIGSEIQKARREVEAAENARIRAEMSRADEHRRQHDKELAVMEQQIKTKLERQRREQEERQEEATRRVETIAAQARANLLKEMEEEKERAREANEERKRLRADIEAEIKTDRRSHGGRKGRRQRPRPVFYTPSHGFHQRRSSPRPRSRASRFPGQQIPTKGMPHVPDAPRSDDEYISQGPDRDGGAYHSVDGDGRSVTSTSDTEQETTPLRRRRYHGEDSADDRRRYYRQDRRKANGFGHGDDSGWGYGRGSRDDGDEESSEDLEDGDMGEGSVVQQVTNPFIYEITRFPGEQMKEGLPTDLPIILRRYLQVYSPEREPQARFAVEILSHEGAQDGPVASEPMQQLYAWDEEPPLQDTQPAGAYRKTNGPRQRKGHPLRSLRSQSVNAEEGLAVYSEDDTFNAAQLGTDDTGTTGDAAGTTDPKLLTEHGKEESHYPEDEDSEQTPAQLDNISDTPGSDEGVEQPPRQLNNIKDTPGPDEGIEQSPLQLDDRSDDTFGPGEGLVDPSVSSSVLAANGKEESDLVTQTPASSLEPGVPSGTHTPWERKTAKVAAAVDSAAQKQQDLQATGTSSSHGHPSSNRPLFRSQIRRQEKLKAAAAAASAGAQHMAALEEDGGYRFEVGPQLQSVQQVG